MQIIMSAAAIGEYFRTLVAEQPGLSLAAVSRAAGVSDNYLSRLGVPGKNGTQEPSARVLLKLLPAAHGKLEYLEELLHSQDAPPEKGRELALRTLEEMKHASSENERQTSLRRLISDLENDPLKLDQWVSYGEWLRSRGLDESQ